MAVLREVTMIAPILLLAIAATAPAGPSDGLAPELLPPVRIEADGKPIDTEVGHAAPFVGDFDGDGVADLLVGQFGGGVLWVFHNNGTDKAPKLAAGQKFKDGAKTGVVPAG
jgi:hypothetical protein